MLVLATLVLAFALVRFAVRRRRLIRCERCKRRVRLDDVVYLPEPPCGLLVCLDCETKRS